jgi:hypothetical protein
MKPAEMAEEDGKKALAHSRAVAVMAYGMAEEDSYSPGKGNLGCKEVLCSEHASYHVYGYRGSGRKEVPPG